MYDTLDDLYMMYSSRGCNISEMRFNEGIIDAMKIPDKYKLHFEITLTNWKHDLFRLVHEKEQHVLESYLHTFMGLRKAIISKTHKEFFACIQSGDVDTFKRMYKSYACDMYDVKNQILERCLKSSTNNILEYYVTERFECMSNIFKYFTADMSNACIVNIIAKCHGWKSEFVNDKVIAILSCVIARHRHLFCCHNREDCPQYIKELIQSSMVDEQDKHI